ncbi:sensor histidine kinase [Actinopolyspora erythraea]|uniref:sensor histidine kinase n=1 Tax=Actinopolyspora erythraea TaxID=414996 RepID=UPI0005B94940|nr:histidine kinase [Actinopolyspora erythraea]
MNSSACDNSASRVRRVHRYTWWAVMPTASVCCLLAIVNLAHGRVSGIYNNVELAVLTAAVLIIAVEGTRACRVIMRGMGAGVPEPVRITTGFAASLIVLGYVTTREIPAFLLFSLLPALFAAAIVTGSRREHRWWMGCGCTALTAGVASTSVVVTGHGEFVPVTAGYAALLTAMTVIVLLVQGWTWDVVCELDRARGTEAELAVARERLRFASELHDVQGHHLQVIALKAELAERMVDSDSTAARSETAEIAETARRALRETRELVHGYRRSDLSTELNNAVRILRAASIETTVEGSSASVPPPLQPLFAAVVREGTTNILRHSGARRCELRIDDTDGISVRLCNDGAGDGSGQDAGSGIAGLRDRFDPMHGSVTAERRGEWFELVGHAPAPGEG